MSQIRLFIIAAFFMIYTSSCGKKVKTVELIPVKAGKEFQYIDPIGEIKINPQFSEASVFHEGLALVKTAGDAPRYGYISEDGTFVIPASYKEATIFSEGLAIVVTENGAPTAIDKKGQIVFTLTQAEELCLFKSGLAAFRVSIDGEDKWGYVDKEGVVKINPQFANTTYFSEELSSVKNTEGKWGYINKAGELVINYQFDGAYQFDNGNAIVLSDGKFGVIGKDGKFLINPQYSDMLSDGDNFLIKMENKWGWCDNKGKITINPQFEDAYPFLSNSLTSVKSGGKWGYIDGDGKIKINPQFDYALPFNGSLAPINASRKWGFIDNEGTYKINPQYEEISEDYHLYLYRGTTTYSFVKSDFFDFAELISEIKIDEEILNNQDWEKIIAEKKLKVTRYDNWGNYEGYEIAQVSKVNKAGNSSVAYELYYNFDIGFGSLKQKYVISLPYTKSKEMLKQLQSSFNGYKEIEGNKLSNGKFVISIKESFSSITLVIELLDSGI